MKTGFGQMKILVTFSGWFALDIVGCKIFVLEARIGFKGCLALHFFPDCVEFFLCYILIRFFVSQPYFTASSCQEQASVS